jgi:hypothetical protein
LHDPGVGETDDLNAREADAAIVEAEDDGNDRDAGADADHRRPWPELCETIGGSAGPTLWHHGIVRASGENRSGGGKVRLDPTAAAPNRKESAKSTQRSGAQATAPNDERPKAEPPDARLRWHRNAKGEGFVIATVRRADENARTRRAKAI